MYFFSRNTFHKHNYQQQLPSKFTFFVFLLYQDWLMSEWQKKARSTVMTSFKYWPMSDWQKQGRISNDFFSQFLEVSACLPRSQLLGETLRTKSEYCIKGAAVVVSSDPFFSLLIAIILRWIFDYKCPDPLCLFSKFQVWTSGSEQPARSWRRWQSGDRSLRLKSSESTFDKKSPLSFCENASIVV